MRSYSSRIREAAGNGTRIRPVKIRDLYDTLCDHLICFSSGVEVEAALFETRFTGPGGIAIILSPYSEIFTVSIGGSSRCDVRVNDEQSYFRALDLSIKHLLTCTSRVTRQ
ncbi:MAG: hypothetical protein JW746_01205 [Candidatus Krumholzibacteriota bacterium]|nr:hypothetical protein [Candidatus Krumholzibacteriota bacterium]